MARNENILVNPLTFMITRTQTDVALRKLREFMKEVIMDVEGLQNDSPIARMSQFNDLMIERLKRDCIWRRVPVFNYFPGFFVTLADYTITVAGIAVALLVQYMREKGALETQRGALEELCEDERTAIELVRLLAILQSIFMFPDSDRGTAKELAVYVLDRCGLENLVDEIMQVVKATDEDEVNHSDAVALILKISSAVAKMVKSPLSSNAKELSDCLVELSKNLDNDPDLEDVIRVLKSEEMTNELKDGGPSPYLPFSYEAHQKRVERIESLREKLGLSERPIAVLLMEAEGIQSLVKRTESLKGLVGFSALIEYGVREASKEVSRRLAEECLVYVGGGEFMAIVPSADCEDLVSHATSRYVNIVGHAGTLKAPSPIERIKIRVHEIVEGPDFTWESSISSSNDLITRSFSRLYYLNKVLMEPVLEHQEVMREECFPATERCRVCGLERAVSSEQFTDQETDAIGPICSKAYSLRNKIVEQINAETVARVENGKMQVEFSSKTDIAQLPAVRVTRNAVRVFCSLLNDEKGRSFVERFESGCLRFKAVGSLDEMGQQLQSEQDGETSDSGYMALISGDGDDFGQLKSNMATLTQYRQISSILQALVEQSLSEALGQVLFKQFCLNPAQDEILLPFQVVYSGGDDFLLTLDSKAILVFLDMFRNSLPRQLSQGTQDELQESIHYISVSMAVCVMKNRAPLYAGLDAGDSLQELTKRHSKANKKRVGSDVAVSIQRFTGIPSEREVEAFFEDKETLNLPICWTDWPRTGRELFGGNGLVELARSLLNAKVDSGALMRVLHKAEEKPPDEIKYTIYYKASRERNTQNRSDEDSNINEKDSERSLKRTEYSRLARAFYVERSGAIKYIFRDLIELMKIIEDRSELLPEGVN